MHTSLCFRNCVHFDADVHNMVAKFSSVVGKSSDPSLVQLSPLFIERLDFGPCLLTSCDTKKSNH